MAIDQSQVNINEPVMFSPKLGQNRGPQDMSSPTTTPVAAPVVTYEHNPFRPEIYRTTEGYLQ